MQVFERANGGTLPEIKFFNLGELTIGGHMVRGLHHGMHRDGCVVAGVVDGDRREIAADVRMRVDGRRLALEPGDVTFRDAAAFVVCANSSNGARVSTGSAHENPAAAVAIVRARDPAVVAAIVVTMLLWASAFVAIRSARTHYGAAPLALGRLVVGCVVLSGLMAVQRVALPPRREWPAIVACGILWFGAYNIALNAGERLIDAGTAAMLVNIAPITIALLATFVLRERLARPLWGGLAVAFAGAVVIGVGSGRHRGGLDGVLLCALAAILYTVAVVIEKPVLDRVSPVAVTWGACVAGAVACLPFAPALVSEIGRAPASSTLLVVYLGAGPTAVAFTTWAYALSRSTMARQGATTYLVPPLTILLSWTALGEVPAGVSFAGGLLCLAGVALTRRRA